MTSWEQLCGLKMLARSKKAKVRKKMLSHQDLQIQGANNNIEVGVGKVTGNSAAWNLGHSFLRPLVSKKKGEGGGTVVHHVVFLLPGFSRCLCSSQAAGPLALSAAKKHEQPHSGHLNAEIVEMTGGPKLWRSLSSCEGTSLRMPSVSLGLDGFKTPSAFRLLFS